MVEIDANITNSRGRPRDAILGVLTVTIGAAVTFDIQAFEQAP